MWTRFADWFRSFFSHRRNAAVAAVALAVTAGIGAAVGLTQAGGDRTDSLTTSPTSSPSESASPTDSASLASPSEMPSIGDTSSSAASGVTLSLVSPASSGQQALLRVHVVAPDAWTAYQISFNGTDMNFPRVWFGAGTANQGAVDTEGYLPVCSQHGDITTPTDTTRDFAFTPLRAGKFHATVLVAHGSCDLPARPNCDWNLFCFTTNGVQIKPGLPVYKGEFDFMVADSGFKYDVNGPAPPTVEIQFEQSQCGRNPPLCLPPSNTDKPGFEFHATDPDGHITNLTVNWGDGTTTNLVRQDIVVPELNDLCGVFDVKYVKCWAPFQIQHTCPRAGVYTITVAATSGGGTRNPQTVTTTRDFNTSDYSWAVTTRTPTPTTS